MAKKAVILLPTLNEKATIEKSIEDVFSQEEKIKTWKFEILVVDSSSTDGTIDLVKKLSSVDPRIHVLSVGFGLGTALIEGHKYSLANLSPDALVQMDADGQVSADVVPRLLKVLDNGYDLAIGSRFVPGGQNNLSLSRRLFSAGSSFICRLLMGPWNIKEFTNSARAFTPDLFKKINLDRLPWKEKTYIIQPAFLHEAILAGARYQEVPLIFKNRAEGYSKNKIVNYTYDVITYCIDARLKKWGFDIPFFYLTRRAKTIVKFGIVGFIGTMVDFLIYNLCIATIGLKPATSKGISTEIAILNNFTLNNVWTFRHRKTKKSFWAKLFIFNLVSFGGLAIGVLIVKFLHIIYGDGFINFLGIQIPYYNLYFFATIPPVMIWNFVANHLITWKHQNESA